MRHQGGGRARFAFALHIGKGIEEKGKSQISSNGTGIGRGSYYIFVAREEGDIYHSRCYGRKEGKMRPIIAS